MSNSFSSDGEQDSTGVLEQVLEILADTCDDLAPCGPSTLSLVQQTLTHLDTARTTPSSPSFRLDNLSRASILSTSLLRLADEKLNTFPYTAVPLCWRRLYTDATLLGAITSLVKLDAGTEGVVKKELEETIKKLDMALIVAGAPGEGREELVFTLMEAAQDRPRALAAVTTSSSPPPSKKRRLSPSHSTTSCPPPYLHRTMTLLSSLPDHLTPIDSSHPHSSPFVVRRAASSSSGWSAVERWRDLDYLRDKAGPGRVVPVEVGGDYTADGWGQAIMPFEKFLSTLTPLPSPSSSSSTAAEEDDKDPPPIHYLAQHSLFRQFPSLLSDLTVPDLVFSAPSTDGQGKSYEGMKTPDGYVMNAWLGPAGTKSAAHTDPYWNVYVQVTGSKWVWVAPPSCSAAMSAFGSSSSSTSSTSPSVTSPTSPPDEPATASSTAEQYMSNTSSLDVTVPPPAPHLVPNVLAPPPRRPEEIGGYYPPRWLAEVEPLARQVVLEAGDALVMPPKWWHAMKSLETSFSVSIWF